MSFFAFDRHDPSVSFALSRFGTSHNLDVRGCECVRLLCVGTVVFWCLWMVGPLRVCALARDELSLMTCSLCLFRFSDFPLLICALPLSRFSPSFGELGVRGW